MDVLVVNPSGDVYGADLQMLESVKAMIERGIRVTVICGADGPLHERIRAAGARSRVGRYPVLRRADATPARALRLSAAAARDLLGMRGLIREEQPDAVYVNTVTLPWWLAAARTTDTPCLCHVHEAEQAGPVLVRRALALPLLLADLVVANSSVTSHTLCSVLPRLQRRVTVVPNGVAAPGSPPTRRPRRAWVQLLVIGRLSPAKSTHTAIETLALLRQAGVDARLEICGTSVPGREDYEAELRDRASRPDVAGAITFGGYCSPVWSALERSDVVLAPSTAESFGNTVVEAQFASRPVVATAVGGHLETVSHESTGLLVPVGDASAMAAAVRRLLDTPALAEALVKRARERAHRCYSSDRYAEDLVAAIERTAAAR